MNRQRLLLAALAGCLLLSLVYAFWAMPRPEQAPPRTPAAVAARAAAAPKGKGAAERLHLEMLDEQPQPFAGAKRDIFRFSGGWAEPVAAPPIMAPPLEAPPPPPPPPTPEQLLREKVSQYTFLGFLERGGVKTVFLSGGGEVFLVKAGERFGRSGDLFAREISASELVVGAAGVDEVVRVPLVENERLTPAVFGAGQAASRPGVGGTAVRPGGLGAAPRRILPQRSVLRAPPPEQIIDSSGTGEAPPDDGAQQEEPTNESLPAGEGNGQ